MSEKIKKYLDLDSQVNPEDLVTSIKLDAKTANEISKIVSKVQDEEREKSRSKLAMSFTKIFSFSLVGSFILILVTATYPKAHNLDVKDLISVIITPQVTLLSFTFGYYFGNKDV